MSKVLTTLQKRNFDTPDKTMAPPYVRMDVVTIGDLAVVRAVWQPGWRWSEHMKPVAGTDTCQGTHFTYFISGHFRTRMDDGTILDCGPGDVLITPPGHDAWVLGDEPVVAVDFQGASRNDAPAAALRLEKKDFDTPDQTITFPNTKIDIVTFGDMAIIRGILSPGWKWSENMKALDGGDWAEDTHFAFIISGRIHVLTSDGEELDLGPGDVAIIPPEHDAWVVGDEPYVAVDILGASRDI